jgi:hypothetical protein
MIRNWIWVDDEDRLVSILASAIRGRFPEAGMHWICPNNTRRGKKNAFKPDELKAIADKHGITATGIDGAPDQARRKLVEVLVAAPDQSALLLDLRLNTDVSTRPADHLREAITAFAGRQAREYLICLMSGMKAGSVRDALGPTRDAFYKHLNLKAGDSHVMTTDANPDADSEERPAQVEKILNQVTHAWNSLFPPPPPAFHDDEPINSVLQLYADCWTKDWDSWRQENAATKKAFGHDHFAHAGTEHARKTTAWMFGNSGLPTGISYHQNSFKGLFMVDHSTGAPIRTNLSRPIKAAILKAALDRLGVKAALQTGIEEWNLPLAPGVAFLVSLKDFLRNLTADAGDKQRPLPESIQLCQWHATAQSGMLPLIYRAEITLGDSEEDGLGLMRSFMTGKRDGATKALANLVCAHNNNVRADENAEWPLLFRLRNPVLEEQVAGIQFIKRGLYIFWHSRNNGRE